MSASCSRRSFRLALTLALTFSLAAGSWPRPQRAASTRIPETTTGAANVPAEALAATQAETEDRAKEAYGKLGVSFEENRGQVDDRVRFLSRGGRATVFLAGDEAAFVLRAPRPRDKAADGKSLREKWSPEALRRGRGAEMPERPQPHAVHMKFEGANPRAEVVGERGLEGRVNYLRGSDPSKWQTNVRTYGAVRYRGIYDGVDLVYYGDARGRMEYDFEVAPGADPRQISLKIDGAEALKLDASGDLVLNTPAGEMRQHRPAVYQEVGGARREVKGGYSVEADGRVRFKLGAYDRSAPLVIDPVVEYATYLGGIYADESNGIAVDSAGNAYVAGDTDSPDFPLADPLRDAITNGWPDAFVTKLNADGSALVYSTFLGGSSLDEAHGIALDSAGNVYITGETKSSDFPVTDGSSSQSNGDAFVLKLSADGSAILYATCFGGDNLDSGNDIAVDSAGMMYVTGDTKSPGFPSSSDTYRGLNGEAFVAKIGSGIQYSLVVGGSGEDSGLDIALDSAGNAYVAGDTRSADFPTANAIQAAYGGDTDAFVLKLSADGSTLVYSTYLGGSEYDSAPGVAVDSAGNAYVAGATLSTDFPVVNPIHIIFGGYADAFLTKINAAGSAIIYSTYLGGSYDDFAFSVEVDSAGNAHLAGGAGSPEFPLVDGGTPLVPGFFSDAFIAKFNADGSALLYSTCFGGNDDDVVFRMALDSSGSAYITGRTFSTDFPVVNPIQGTDPGIMNAYVAKFILLPKIRGRVTTQGPPGVVGVPWATVKLIGPQTMTKLTDAHGYYSFTGLVPGGDYAVTLSKANLSFVPESQSLTDLHSIIYDADFTVPSLSVDNVAVTEGDATAAFTVRLQPASGEPVTVSYRTMNGTFNPAAAGKDYTALPLSQVTFAPGETEKTVAVGIKGDALDERNETLFLRLSAPTNAVISDNTGVCTITDDDAAPSISISDRRVTEPDAGTVNAAFAVTLSAPSSRTITVKFRTADGTAAAGTDYTALALTTLTFSPGQTIKYVTVQVNGDTLKEGNETFFVKLSGAFNASIADAQGLGKITDDD